MEKVMEFEKLKKQYEPCDKDPKLSIVLFECLCGGFQYLQEQRIKDFRY